jgi:hypothetical protein
MREIRDGPREKGEGKNNIKNQNEKSRNTNQKFNIQNIAISEWGRDIR